MVNSDLIAFAALTFAYSTESVNGVPGKKVPGPRFALPAPAVLRAPSLMGTVPVWFTARTTDLASIRLGFRQTGAPVEHVVPAGSAAGSTRTGLAPGRGIRGRVGELYQGASG